RIGIRLDTISVEPMFNAYLEALKPAFDGLKPDVTEENLQARIRGGLLMAYSNKFGSLLLTTGNKSEVAVGYATLYGDMAGGLSVISDLYKNDVYALSRYINEIDERHPIPENTITKPPSAELREDQTDQDSLPEYDILDAILHLFVDEALGVDAIIEKGFDAAVVERIAKLVIRAEYKRRQAAPGLRISPKAFGEGRRLPIAQGFLG
ncbi:NAD(+) synthase, partial [Myxococcota bacterium]|nr:NAD(+) synthase [Myxococcota bacterium]